MQTLQRLTDIFKIRAKYKRNEEAVGFGLANAQGIHMATGKYIALINNDMCAARPA